MKITQNIISAIVGILLMVILLQWDKQIGKTNEAYQLLSDTTAYFNSVQIETGKFVTMQDQRIVSFQGAVSAGLLREKELERVGLKKASTIISLKAEIRRLNLLVDYDVPPEIIYITDTIYPPGKYLRIPQKFTFQDTWTGVWGTVDEQTTIDSLMIRVEPSIYLGYKKQGWLKSMKPVVVLKDNNPYLNVTDMQNVTIKYDVPFYKTANWHRLEGIVTAGLVVFLLK